MTDLPARFGLGRIDAHHHFLDPQRFAYPWIGNTEAALRSAFGADELRPCLRRVGVTGTVVVQALHDVLETEWLLGVAAGESFVQGVVGWTDLTNPGVDDELARLRECPGGQYLVGVRHQVHDELDATFLSRRDVQRGIRALARAGLALDLLVRTRELTAALEVAQAFPELCFVVDHCAKPPIASGDLLAWASALKPLARASNVTCKVSGLVTEANWQRWSPADLVAAVECVVSWFGPDRMMVGSDWPVCTLAASYEEVMATLDGMFEGWSAPDRQALFRNTAVSAYGLRYYTR